MTSEKLVYSGWVSATRSVKERLAQRASIVVPCSCVEMICPLRVSLSLHARPQGEEDEQMSHVAYRKCNRQRGGIKRDH